MSQALYVGMFSQIQLTASEKKRARKKWMLEKAAKALGYIGAIAGMAAMSHDPIQATLLSSVVCLVAECFR